MADGAAITRIRLLGRFAVLKGPEQISLRSFGGRLPQQLLRLLALRRGALVPKDVIADALWPTGAPANPSANIEVLVCRARRALGDHSLIETGPSGYTLTRDGRCWVDAEAFLADVESGRTALAERPRRALAAFRQAVELWRGEPLTEDTYAEWAQQDRRNFSLALLDALEGASRAALRLGDPADAARWARCALAREPLREASAMLTAQALAASGDRAGALATLDAYQRRLAAEAGLELSPGAGELRQRILLGQHGPGRPPPESPAGDGRPRQRWAPAPAARELLILLTLLSRPAPAALLAAASARPLPEVLTDLECLAQAGLSQAEPGGWVPGRPQAGQALLAALDPLEESRYHAVLAEALRGRPAPEAHPPLREPVDGW